MPELDLDAIAARRAAVPGELDGPWFLSDCDGTLQIWLEAVLRNVTRDETGRITGYRLPASFRPTDLIAEWDLEYWDEGVDEDDDKRRALAQFLTYALQDVQDLIAEVRRTREDAKEQADPDRKANRRASITSDEDRFWLMCDDCHARIGPRRVHVNLAALLRANAEHDCGESTEEAKTDG